MTTSSAAFRDSIARFAELRARLDDVFADRGAVLALAGLDEVTYAQLTASWIDRLHSVEGTRLAEQFGEAYATARRAAVGEDTAAPPVDGRFLSRQAQPWRAAAAAVPLNVHGEAPSLAMPADLGAAPDTWPAVPSNGGSSAELTAEIPVLDPVPVLPFSPPRGRRLHRFDSQTGAPLAVPFWSDDPVGPKKPA